MTHAKGRICIISDVEHNLYLRGVHPQCKDHSHCKVSAAHEMCRTDVSPYKVPIASWVGPHHIIQQRQFHLVVKDRSPLPRELGGGFLQVSTMQVVAY